MNFSAACPSCGAAIEIAEQAERVDCPFCGSHFELDQSGAAPTFRKSEAPPAPKETFVPDDADILTPSDVTAPAPPAWAAAPSTRPSDPFADIPEQPFNLPFYQQVIGRVVDKRLLYALAAAVVVIFCLSCLCLLTIVRALFGGQ